MSETVNIPIAHRRLRARILLVILSVLILLLVYGAGFVLLPVSILTSYQGKNCNPVASLNEAYTSIYPEFIQDKSLSARVMECDAYLLATLNEEKGLWHDAYEAYQVYVTTYPGGLYVQETHEHSAVVLLNMTREQFEQKKYDEAVANLNLIVSNYSDTGASTEAWTLTPLVYTSWGAGLRESREFEKSERVLADFKTWSQTNQKTDFETDAKTELAQTYLAWGLDLQSQKQFEAALAKFDLAMSVDPEPSQSAVQARTSQIRTYIEWGNDLLARNEFSAAIEKLGLAVSRSDGNNEDGVRDALANGHVQWAADLSASEDFQGALEQLEKAKETAFTDVMKRSVDVAFAGTYTAFSNSTGAQATRAMRDALKAICEQHKKPDLPIFGLNKDLIHVGLYGVEGKLPEEWAAKTPGEMHYVACIDVEKQTVESRSEIYIFGKSAKGYYWMRVQQYRIQILWNVSLQKIDAGEEVAQKILEGGTPPPYPEAWNDVGDGYYFGAPPEMSKLTAWLQSAIK